MVKRKEIVGWCLFDVANSSYTTVIITVFYARIFSEVIVGPNPSLPRSEAYGEGNFLWALAVGASSFIAAAIGPLLGTISDLAHRRKIFLAGSVALCSLSCFGLYFVEPGMIRWAMFLILLSNMGFALSENFISSFLPHISTPSNIGRISGWGWGLGYLGGLVSIILCQIVLGVEDQYTEEVYSQLRWIGPITGCFFILFSLPTFLVVSEPKPPEREAPLPGRIVAASYREVANTLRSLSQHNQLARFLLSFFFFYGGLSIVISFAALYASQVAGISGVWQAIFFVSLQVSAVIGSVGFGYLQDRIGALKTVNLTLVIWIITILALYFLKPILVSFGIEDFRLSFIMVGNGAGLCLGATQASSRTIVGILSPKDRSGEFYGFWGLSGKLAAVFAVVTFGTLQRLFTLESAMLGCIAFFIVGLILNSSIKLDSPRSS